MTRIVPSLLVASLLCACGTHHNSAAPGTSVLFSVQMSANALSNQPINTNGCLFMVDEHGLITARTSMPDGAMRETRFSALESQALRHAIDEIGFESFDYGEEVARADRLRWANAKRDGGSVALHAFDGAEFEIEFKIGSQAHNMKMWNPRTDLGLYAPHSVKIAKLKAVLDLFAPHCQRAGFAF